MKIINYPVGQNVTEIMHKPTLHSLFLIIFLKDCYFIFILFKVSLRVILKNDNNNNKNNSKHVRKYVIFSNHQKKKRGLSAITVKYILAWEGAVSGIGAVISGFR